MSQPERRAASDPAVQQALGRTPWSGLWRVLAILLLVYGPFWLLALLLFGLFLLWIT